MTTSTVSINITCPDWCTVSPEEHAQQLGDLDGLCDHRGEYWQAIDPTGYREALAEPKISEPITVWIAALTTIEGRPAASPVVFIEGVSEFSTLDQAANLIKLLQRVIDHGRELEGRR